MTKTNKKIRLNFDVSQNVVNCIDQLVEESCATRSEFCRDALKLFIRYVQETQKGNVFYYEKPGVNDSRVEIVLPRYLKYD